MADIAELSYSVDSSALTQADQALGKVADSAQKADSASQKFEADFSKVVSAIESGSKSIRDGFGGASSQIIAELQRLNTTQSATADVITQLRDIMAGYQTQIQGVSEGLKGYSSSAKQAESETARLARAAKEAEEASRAAAAAAAEQDARYKAIARRAIEFAEANRTANRSERGLAEAAREAAAGIDTKAAVMQRAGTEQERMARRVEALRAAEARTTAEVQKAARATELRELNLRKLTGQIDPTIAKLDRLAELEKRLERARDIGAINEKTFKQYQDRIDATRAATLRAGQASDAMTNSLGKLNLQSVETQQSLVSLVRSLATGQWGQAQSSIASLTARTGVLSGVFRAAAIPIGGFAAALGGLSIAYYSGWKESRELEKSLIGLGGASAITQSRFFELRREVGGLTMNYQAAGVAIAELMKNSRNNAEMVESFAKSATNLSTLTGESVTSVASEIQKLGESGSDALVSLNEKYGFLTLETARHIEEVRRERGEFEANIEAMRELERVSDERAQQMVASAGYIESAFRGVRTVISEIKEGLLDLGRANGGAERNLTRLAALAKLNLGRFNTLPVIAGVASEAFGRGRTPGISMSVNQEYEAELNRIEKERVQSELEANRASKDSEQAIERRIAGVDRESAKLLARNAIIEDFNRLSVRDPNNRRLFDGSQERLLREAEKKVDDQFNRREGRNKQNTDNNSAARLLETIQRQITANEQLAETGEKVSASDRLVIQARQLLDDKTNTMTASTRRLLESMLPVLKATDEQAEATQRLNRDRAANAALTERLAQVEKLRQEQAEVDLLGMGRGSEVTDALRRQLEIQREYLKEVDTLKRAQRNKNTALSAEEYAVELRLLEDSRDRRLEIERQFNEQRMAIMGDWRNGAIKAAEDYLASGRNVAAQYEQAFNNAFTGMEDALVKFVTTGKFSFTDLANSIIADLARIAARQAITGLVGNILSAFMPGASTAAGVSSSQLMKGSSFTMQGQSWGGSFGGGREYGGSVNSGSLYQVGERGKPELFTAGSKQYLIPGDNGRVEPIKSSHTQTGSQQMPTRIAINLVHKGQPIDVESQSAEQQPDGSLLINMVTNTIKQDMARGGFDQTFRSIGIAQNRGARG